MLRLFLLSALSLLITSCGNYKDIKAPLASKDMGPSVLETKLNFATIKSEILDSQCISCHTGRHKSYDSYSVVQASAQAMLERIETSDAGRAMPKDGPRLSPEKMAMFREWVQAGAPEFSNSEPQPKPIATIGISFEDVKQKVLNPYNCTGCHSQFNDYKTTYKARGSILSLVTSDQMPFPQRKNLPVEHVKDEDKKILMDWVGQGAPEFAGQTNINVVEEELKPTFLSLRNKVFGPKCILCHNQFGNRGFGKSLDTFLAIRQWMAEDPTLIQVNKETGEAQGLLIEAVLRDSDDPLNFFTPMPLNTSKDDVPTNIPRITEDELKVIKKWIELGLPYNEEEL